jgi:hypothetical protein
MVTARLMPLKMRTLRVRMRDRLCAVQRLPRVSLARRRHLRVPIARLMLRKRRLIWRVRLRRRRLFLFARV